MGVKALVVAGKEDAVVDVQANEENAEYYGAAMAVVEGIGHDLMLVRWGLVSVGGWLDQPG